MYVFELIYLCARVSSNECYSVSFVCPRHVKEVSMYHLSERDLCRP